MGLISTVHQNKSVLISLISRISVPLKKIVHCLTDGTRLYWSSVKISLISPISVQLNYPFSQHPNQGTILKPL